MSSNSWLPLVEEYLSVRRGLGFALETPAYLLRDFARYADTVGHRGPLTTELAVRWSLASRSNNPARAVRRLAAVRQFARYRALLDPATEVPPPGLLGRLPRRPQPHIYSDDELAALLHQASLLRPRGGLRPLTYVAFFSLLACTGLRLSEACQLAVEDVDLSAGVLTVREGKFRKARLVPLHRARRRRSRATPQTETPAAKGRGASSGPSARPRFTKTLWRRRSAGSGGASAGPLTGGHARREFTTSDTVLLCGGCCAGMRRVPTSSASCSPYPCISGIMRVIVSSGGRALGSRDADCVVFVWPISGRFAV
jgi:integrase